MYLSMVIITVPTVDEAYGDVLKRTHKNEDGVIIPLVRQHSNYLLYSVLLGLYRILLGLLRFLHLNLYL